MVKLPNGEDIAPERLYTLTEAAALAGVSERTLIRLTKSGRGPPTKHISPRRIRYPAGDLKRWLEART
jgi:excisionase family DNA binding protein